MPEPMRPKAPRREHDVLPGSYEGSPVERFRKDLREACFEYTAWGNRRPADPQAFGMLEASHRLLDSLEDLARGIHSLPPTPSVGELPDVPLVAEVCGWCTDYRDGEVGPCAVHAGLEELEEPPKETAPIRVSPWSFFWRAPWRVRAAILRKVPVYLGIRCLGAVKTYGWALFVMSLGTTAGIALARLLGVMP